MSKLEKISYRWRLCCLALAIFALFSLLIAQFFKIQITQGAQWEKTAQRQHFFTVSEPFHRGTFFPNSAVKHGHPDTGQSLVVDVQKFHLHIDPQSIPEKNQQEVADKLIALLQVAAQRKELFRSQFLRRSRNRQLAVWLERAKQQQIAAWWYPYAKENKIAANALFFISDYQRSYPFGKLLGQVLHTIRSMRDSDNRQVIPTGGLELTCDPYLRGRPGKRRLKRSPCNAFETGEIISEPIHGADIHLTINQYLQAIAEEELERGVKNHAAKGGWALMMDPYTGEILASAQYPFFFPAECPCYFNDPKLQEHTRVKAVCDALETGSVIKALTAAAALYANEQAKERKEAPLFDPEAKMPTDNGRFPGRTQPLKDGHFYRFMNLDIAIQKSANIYMARLAELMVNRFGAGWYREFLRDHFGFGQLTGIELPAESAGVLPKPGKMHQNGCLEWSASTPSAIAIGYNIQATPLQLVRAYAVLANGGYLVRPTLIRKIIRRHPNGAEELLVDHTATGPGRSQPFPRVLSSAICKRITRALKFTTKPGGIARRGDILGYTEAGKSATCKKIVNGAYRDIYRASFIGFTPAAHANFVLLVTLDEPEYRFIPGVGKNHNGGICAAAVFRAIARRSLEYLGIAPDDPHGYPVGDPRYDADKSDWLPEARKLQELCEKWND